MKSITSVSPFGKSYESDAASEENKINNFIDNDRKCVVIQGLGFVGGAMMAALANASNEINEPLYNVIGVDLCDENNFWKIGRVMEGLPPIKSTDDNLDKAYSLGSKRGNLMATYDNFAYSIADVIVIDIHLDIFKSELGNTSSYTFSYDHFKKALLQIAQVCREDALIIIETTVPPGTTEKVAYPVFMDIFQERGLKIENLKLAHSYERVMPGPNYLDSITNFFRVFSGVNTNSKDAARNFLSSFINTKDFPLSELDNPTSSEMAKVLENSYRAMNIAFISEWSKYAEISGVDLYEVVDAIRVRPTHSNIMSPGFGVGGYCLTKDSLLADWSMKNLFHDKNGLNMTLSAIEVNDLMPSDTFKIIIDNVGTLSGKKVTLMGISYINDVADTRYSPSYLFSKLCIDCGAMMNYNDPLVEYWDEMEEKLISDIAENINYKHDIVVFAVRHKEYLNLTTEELINYFPGASLFVDAFNILDKNKISELSLKGIKVVGIGKGNLNY